MKMRLDLCLFFLTAFYGATVEATVLTGAIDNLPESHAYLWGDGTHNIMRQEWSVARTGRGYFYGRDYFWSNVDVYTVHNLADPLSIKDASVFSYDAHYTVAENGDTVFFRNANGYYGAWSIDEIVFDMGHSPAGYLWGRWYFQDDGSANFTVPEPSTIAMLLTAALGGLLWWRRRR